MLTKAITDSGDAVKYPEQLRAAIDRGDTRDKVAGSDPAAAPLGTDEEAAGTPIPRAAVQLAFRQETNRDSNPKKPANRGLLWLIAVVCFFVIAFFAFVLGRFA